MDQPTKFNQGAGYITDTFKNRTYLAHTQTFYGKTSLMMECTSILTDSESPSNTYRSNAVNLTKKHQNMIPNNLSKCLLDELIIINHNLLKFMKEHQTTQSYQIISQNVYSTHIYEFWLYLK